MDIRKARKVNKAKSWTQRSNWWSICELNNTIFLLIIESGQGRPPIWCRSRSPKIPSAAVPSSLVDTGRTMEQVYAFFMVKSIERKVEILHLQSEDYRYFWPINRS